MRRRLTIATFVLLLAVMPAAAQHGGGHAGGGHASFGGGGHGGFSGHSGFGGGHVSSGMRSGSGVSRGFTHGPTFSHRGFQGRSFQGRSFRGRSSSHPFLHDGFRGRRFRTYGFRNNCYGYGCGFYSPYAYGGFYDPYWWGDSSSSYDEDYEHDRDTANEMNQQSLEEQRMRRQEDADGDQDIYNQPSQSRPAPGSTMNSSAMNNGPQSSPQNDPQDDAIIPPTVLVFRDQHKLEIRNYAIVGQTLWSFGSPRTQKIPLADLDLAATIKANDERGLTFRVPSAGEAQ